MNAPPHDFCPGFSLLLYLYIYGGPIVLVLAPLCRHDRRGRWDDIYTVSLFSPSRYSARFRHS